MKTPHKLVSSPPFTTNRNSTVFLRIAIVEREVPQLIRKSSPTFFFFFKHKWENIILIIWIILICFICRLLGMITLINLQLKITSIREREKERNNEKFETKLQGTVYHKTRESWKLMKNTKILIDRYEHITTNSFTNSQKSQNEFIHNCAVQLQRNRFKYPVVYSSKE